MCQPAAHRLHAGDVCCEYAGGSLRHIRAGNCEVIQHIYFALRDHNWTTIPFTIQHEKLHARVRSFEIEFEARHTLAGIDFYWRATISGYEDGRISYAVAGEARSAFLRNRIGLCVLHSAEDCHGLECTLEHTAGGKETSRFPDLVAPHQPFVDLRALSHSPTGGMAAELRFEGDIFETEDQRNWSDASFKTYSTPLSAPYPVQMGAGDQVNQKVELRVCGTVRAAGIAGRELTAIDLTQTDPLPLRDLGVVSQPTRTSDCYAFLRVDLALHDAAWRDKLRSVAEAGMPLEVVATLDNQSQLRELQAALKPLGQQIKRLALFDTATAISNPMMLSAARQLFTGVSIGGGSNKHFAELNRNRALAAVCDFLLWPVDPQVHATDEQTSIENLGGQRAALETANSFSRALPMHISPIAAPDFPAASGWAVICAKNLMLAGARSLTFTRPLAAIEQIIQLQAEELLPSTSSNPLAADALLLRKGGRVFGWIANFLPAKQEIAFAGKRMLLNPYELTRIELAT